MTESKNKFVNHADLNGCSWRMFGTKSSDLDLDLVHGPRPELVTRILSSCLDTNGHCLKGATESSDNGRSHGMGKMERGTGSNVEDIIWKLSVGERTRNLLSIGLEGFSSIALILTCPHEKCGEPMEVELPLESLRALQDGVRNSEIVTIPLPSGNLEVRRPTGYDQKKWLATEYPSVLQAKETMISTLISDTSRKGDITPEVIMTINDSMAEADPLVNFGVTVRCPHCGEERTHFIDLEEIAITRLQGTQHRLIRTVHLLASRYHWSEREILSLPPWRRNLYLSLIEHLESQ